MQDLLIQGFDILTKTPYGYLIIGCFLIFFQAFILESISFVGFAALVVSGVMFFYDISFILQIIILAVVAILTMIVSKKLTKNKKNNDLVDLAKDLKLNTQYGHIKNQMLYARGMLFKINNINSNELNENEKVKIINFNNDNSVDIEKLTI
ncbi:putative membrane protein [Campylobacter pinnipediorum subsp. pinnipediorum]|uniref:hypothetical protein n=1 Tax=Campylobacter pinnipediorum TaxID=1965231 RepID=UPI000994B29F|nr:hypothetical protein [Campylobacter pinnipediorum]AQW81634.1 putative membrane protein [Campylobacter pinnipediorum subsp. pinnipediorum]